MNWVDLIRQHFNDWLANPVSSVVALFLGFGIAYFLLMERIHILKERIGQRDDLLKLKDQTIETQTENVALVEASVTPPPPESIPSSPLPSDKKPDRDRFREINDQITRASEEAILRAINGGR